MVKWQKTDRWEIEQMNIMNKFKNYVFDFKVKSQKVSRVVKGNLSIRGFQLFISLICV